MELVEFLQARLNEDEQVCVEALDLPPMVGEWRWARVSANSTRFSPCGRYHPSRVLREVQAKRAILDRYEDCRARLDDPDYSSVEAAGQLREYEDFVLPALALPYADHQDYSAEWAPDVTVK